MFRFSVVLFLMLGFSCNGKTLNRDKRSWFGYRYTSTYIKPQIVTSYLPSSCVHVEPSLPPCRNVRYLNHFPNIISGRLISTDGEFGKPVEDINNLHDYIEPSIGTTPLGWGEYLGIYAPTVTLTAVHLETVTVMDPKTVVTFSVRGCKPSRLPMDLATCDPDDSITPTPQTQIVMTSTVYKPEISLPDSGVGEKVEKNDQISQNNFAVHGNPLNPGSSENLQPSVDNLMEGTPVTRTEELGSVSKNQHNVESGRQHPSSQRGSYAWNHKMSDGK